MCARDVEDLHNLFLRMGACMAVPRPKRRRKRSKKNNDGFVVYQGSRLNQLTEWLRSGARLPGAKGKERHA